MARAGKHSVEDAPDEAVVAAANPRRRRGRRGRKTLFWLALLGGLIYAVARWQQQQVDLDEGVWHEAPTSES
jgi:hypothetical protein